MLWERERVVGTRFPDPFKAQQTNYNLDKSGILRSSACGEGISFATPNKLSCLYKTWQHLARKPGAAENTKLFIPVSSRRGWASRWALCLALGKDTTDLASKEPTTNMVRQDKLSKVSTVQHKSPWPCALLLLPLWNLPCLPVTQIPYLVANMPSIVHPTLYPTLYSVALQLLPSRVDFLSPCLGWLCDLLRPIECGRNDGMPVLNMGLKRSRMLPLSLRTLPPWEQACPS